MLKHIGKHGDKKIVLVFRQIPGDDHMCLVLYSDMLPQLVHDETMKCLESTVGQSAKELSDAMHRYTMANGQNLLETVHKSGYLKKVNTNQIIITPNAKSSVRLDELNTILNEMDKGEEAIKRLADMDQARGLAPNKKRRNEQPELGVPPSSRSQPATTPTTDVAKVLTDSDLAASRLAQAELMKKNAATMMAEAERLIVEAAGLDPTIKTKDAGTTKKKKAKVKAS